MTDQPGPITMTFEEEARAASVLLEAGKAQEAVRSLQALARAQPENAGIWAVLAKCFERLGDADAELAAANRFLALDAGPSRLRMRAAMILAGRGDIAAAADHYQVLSDARPQDPKLARRLGRSKWMLGDAEGEAVAWTRLLAIEPDDLDARRRMVELHEKAGRLAEAIADMRRIAETTRDQARDWNRMARLCEASGDFVEAETIWRRVIELDPRDLDAAERLEALRMTIRRAPSAGQSGRARLRLAVFGNCQAYAMARCLRAILPDAEIAAASWPDMKSGAHLGKLREMLDGVDAVLAQPLGLDTLSREALLRDGPRCVLFPSVHFTGFHPDTVRSPDKRLRPLVGGWHSALIMAAWRMGLPAARTEELFNAYIYGVLGYFDEYAKASTFLLRMAARIGWDLAAELDSWPRPFVHDPEHPVIEAMMPLAERTCLELGLEPDAQAAAPQDPFLRFGEWPIYPEIAKRLGLNGDMVFASRFGKGRAFALREVIDWYYAAYANATPDALALPRVDQVMELLRAEGI
jgi:tetratricopeptide (TPR) repeat protein